MIASLKSLLPNKPIRSRILFGPLRGAMPMLVPRNSMRYILGLYEHELNEWLSRTIPTVNALFDVGANHGYFSLGVLSAWQRHDIDGQVWAFEPQAEEVQRIQTALTWHGDAARRMQIQQSFVSDADGPSTVSLNRYISDRKIPVESLNALVKIDVEGAEIKVLEGASRLVRPGNRFLVEVHSAALLEEALEFFSSQDHAVSQIIQRPLPLIGRENRDHENCWVVSD